MHFNIYYTHRSTKFHYLELSVGNPRIMLLPVEKNERRK